MKKILYTTCLAFFSIISFSQTTENFHEFDGHNRRYLKYIPSSYDGTQEFPLIIMLHREGSPAETIMDVSNFNQFAEDNNFIVVYPEAIEDIVVIAGIPIPISHVWNAGQITPGGTTDDVGFLSELITELITTHAINPNTVFMAGYQTGGSLAQRFALEHDDQVTAIASVSGPIAIITAITNIGSTSQMPIIYIHGTDNQLITYDGTGPINIPLQLDSAEDTLAFWENKNNCNDQLIEIFSDSNPNNIVTLIERFHYENCDENLRTEHYKYTGLGASWPEEIEHDIAASERIWDFFNFYIENSTLSVVETNELTASIYPNPAQKEFFIDNPYTDTLMHVEIYNILGEKIMDLNDYSSGDRIDITTLKTGIYIGTILNKNQKSSFKLLKQ